MNSAHAKVQLPNVSVKLFVKVGWQARDGVTQMQYYGMGGSGAGDRYPVRQLPLGVAVPPCQLHDAEHRRRCRSQRGASEIFVSA